MVYRSLLLQLCTKDIKLRGKNLKLWYSLNFTRTSNIMIFWSWCSKNDIKIYPPWASEAGSPAIPPSYVWQLKRSYQYNHLIRVARAVEWTSMQISGYVYFHNYSTNLKLLAKQIQDKRVQRCLPSDAWTQVDKEY